MDVSNTVREKIDSNLLFWPPYLSVLSEMEMRALLFLHRVSITRERKRARNRARVGYPSGSFSPKDSNLIQIRFNVMSTVGHWDTIGFGTDIIKNLPELAWIILMSR